MKTPILRYCLSASFALALANATAHSQVMDDPVQVSVTFMGEAYLDGWQGADYPEIEVSWQGGSLGSAFNWLWGPSWYSLGSAQIIQMKPGKVYPISVHAAGALEHKLLFDAPPGYTVYFDQVPRDYMHSTDSLGWVDSWSSHHEWEVYMVRVERDEEPLEFSGQASSLRSHAVIWRVGMGKLMNGRSAGQLSIREATPSASLYTTDSLFYDDPSSEVEVILQSNKLRQVYANEALADIVTLSATSYEIRYYHRDDVGSKSGGLYTFTGSPFVVYQIRRNGTDNNHLIIDQTRGSTTWEASLQKSGSTWTMKDWSTSSTAYSREVDAEISASTRRRTLYESGTSTKAREVTHEYGTYSWGQELEKVTVSGTAGQPSLVREYDYSAGRLLSRIEADGSWEKYDYYTSFMDRGLLHRTYRPWVDSPSTPSGASATNADVTTYTYTTNLETGWKDWPSNRERKINNVLAGKTTWSYTTPGAINSKGTTQITRRDYSDPSNYLTTITRRYWVTLPDALYRGQVVMERRPDGTQVSYAYERGTYSGGSFTPGSSGPDVRVWALEGTASANGSSGSQAISALGSQTIPTLYPVTRESILSATIRSRTGRVVREESYVYDGGTTFALIEIQEYEHTKWGEVKKVTRPNIGGTAPTHTLYEATFNASGQKTQETDESATSFSMTYDERQRLKDRTHNGIGSDGIYPAQGAVTTYFTYDAADRVTRQRTGPNSSSTSTIDTEWDYDFSGRVIAKRERRPSSTWYTTTTSYQDSSRRRTITYPGGATRIEDWRRDGRLYQVSGSAQVGEYYSLSFQGDQTFLKQRLYSSGNNDEWQNYFTDWLGRPVKDISTSHEMGGNPLATQTNRLFYYYNTSGQKTRVENSSNATIGKLRPDFRYEYTSWGRLLRTGYDQNGSSSLTLSGQDRITEFTRRFENISGAWWYVEKDEVYRTGGSTAKTAIVERRTRITGLNGPQIAQYQELDANGNVTTTTHSLNVSLRRVLVQTSHPGSSTLEETRIRNGRTEHERTSTGVFTQYIYDTNGRLSETHGRNDVKTRLIYHTGSSSVRTDIVKDVQRWKPGTGWQNVETLAYDTAGRVSLRTRIGGRTERFLYNSRGQVTHQWGTGVTPVRYEYNSYGRITHQHTYRGGTGWGGASWPSSPGTADTTLHLYDALSGQLTEIRHADGNSTTFTYNARGQVKTRTWERGVTTTYLYHVLNTTKPEEFAGELRMIDYSDSTTDVEFKHNRFGAISEVKDAAGTRTFAYRADLQLEQENLPTYYGSSRVIRPIYATTGYVGRLTHLRYGPSTNPENNYQVQYTYDGATGRVSSLAAKTQSQTRTLSYTYLAGSDQLNEINSGYFKRAHTWQTWRDVLSEIQQTWNSANRYRAVYVTADTNQHTKETTTGGLDHQHGHFNGRVTDWTYTDRYELATQAVTYPGYGTGPAHTLSYDNAQNRSQLVSPVQGGTIDYLRNNLNQYTKATLGGVDENFTHDLDGNLTKDGTWDSYTYDAENRLIAMQETGVRRLEFVYDYLGRRIQKQRWSWTGSSWSLQLHHRYVYNGWDLLAVLQSNGTTLVQTFAWGPTAEGGWGGAGGLAIAWEGGNHFFPVVDGRQNIAGYLNTSGSWKQTAEFDAFGNTINSSGTVSFPFGYKGYFRDLDTGMYYLGHRYYNPLTGRFLNRDPIGEAGGLNLYAHTANDYINQWDVRGLSPFDGTEDLSLWDPFFGFVFRALSDGGVRYNRYHADNARYENWLRGQFRPDPGLGNPGASRSFAMARADRGPAVRKSHDARYAWWGNTAREAGEAAIGGGGVYLKGLVLSPIHFGETIISGYQELGGLVGEAMTGDLARDQVFMILHPISTAQAVGDLTVQTVGSIPGAIVATVNDPEALGSAIGQAGLVGGIFKGVNAARTNPALGRGTTADLSKGTTLPRNLREQLAVEQAMSAPRAGSQIPIQMTDPRWPASDGWVKMQQVINSGGREGPINVHYLRNTVSGAVDDFKIVLPGAR